MSYPWEKDYCYRVGEELLAGEGGLNNHARRKYVFQLVRSAVNLAERAGVSDLKFSSVSALERFHRVIIKTRSIKDLITKEERVTFPLAPYAGTENIQPITTYEDYLKERVEMYDCDSIPEGGGEAEMLRVGYRCYYRVFEPVRAIVSLHNCYPGWEVLECLGPACAKVSPEVRNEIGRALLTSPSQLDVEQLRREKPCQNTKDVYELISLMKMSIDESAKQAVDNSEGYKGAVELHHEIRN